MRVVEAIAPKVGKGDLVPEAEAIALKTNKKLNQLFCSYPTRCWRRKPGSKRAYQLVWPSTPLSLA
ncbi:hypothetical protein [Trichocoleus sp. FACHB-90]|uniref:hypothetical protein n=1 Tax=Cyanophyceae TaxID=3028117 RepID=UPI001A7EC69F|nr:hypothetical protein [Trichocoleus sp. FACHB-90]